MTNDFLRPYAAAFTSRFLQVLQYRVAAFAGFMTQCWWGGIKVMVYAAFYHASPAAAAAAPMSLDQVITYTWLAQGLLALSAWNCDPDIALAVRTGTVGYDRLRPVDEYALWYARSAGWATSRALPRVALMFALTAVVFPLVGLGAWSWHAPPSLAQAALFTISMAAVVALSTSIVMLLNIGVAVTLSDRWATSSLYPAIVVLSGNLLPLALYPAWTRQMLFLQPFAGLVDIPFRIYTGNLAGADAWFGIALQVAWTFVLVMAGRVAMGAVMRRLEVQGG